MDERDRRAFGELLWRMRVVAAEPEELERLFLALDADRGRPRSPEESTAQEEEEAATEEISGADPEDPLPRARRLRLLEKMIAPFIERGEWTGPESNAREAAERIDRERTGSEEPG